MPRRKWFTPKRLPEGFMYDIGKRLTNDITEVKRNPVVRAADIHKECRNALAGYDEDVLNFRATARHRDYWRDDPSYFWKRR